MLPDSQSAGAPEQSHGPLVPGMLVLRGSVACNINPPIFFTEHLPRKSLSGCSKGQDLQRRSKTLGGEPKFPCVTLSL